MTSVSSAVQGRSLGMGLSGVSDYSTELPFLDVFKLSRSWFTQSATQWDTNEADRLDLDENGWIKSLPSGDGSSYNQAGTLLFREIPGAYRSGRYVVFYEGEGTIEYGFDAVKATDESSVGRDVLQVDSSGNNGIHLKITATDPNNTGNYLRNIRIYHEDDLPLVELGLTFNPDFLKKIKDFGTLRFMDWMQTNGSSQQDWVDRPQVSDARWTTQGVPLEIMVELANLTGASPWFNMPHQATDDYMSQFATLVRDRLDPNLKSYVEFTNEIWNWMFPQAQYAVEQAQQRWGDDPTGGAGWMQWYGMQTAEMARIWKAVFGAESADRLSTVISTQTAWRGLEQPTLDTPAWVAEGNAAAATWVDAYAITGYFSGGLGKPENAEVVRSWLAEPDGGFSKALQQLRSGELLAGDYQDSLADAIALFQYHAPIAQQYGLEMVGYEGGQHVVGIQGVENDAQLVNFFTELNRRPEMQALYDELLQGWKNAGGNLFNHYVAVSKPTKWGSWGALESLNQDTSPKYAAMNNFMQQTDRWWNESGSGIKMGLYQQGTDKNDQMTGSDDSDILLAGVGDDVIADNLGQDYLHGEAGDDRLDGGANADRIAGGNGVDTLIGGAGNDRLIGGFGADVLTGGEGGDVFVYSGFTDRGVSSTQARLMSLAAAPDRLTDFYAEQGDRFQLDLDHNSSTREQPIGLFDAGVVGGGTLVEAVQAAYADKNQAEPDRQNLNAEEAVFFTWADKTYLSINDRALEFSGQTDLVVDLTGLTMRSADAGAGTLNVTDYFI